jgi:hypothetical protein
MSELIGPVLKKKKKKKTPIQQVATVAGNVVSKKGYVSAIDLFLGIGWLTQDKLSDWKKGKIPYLEQVVTANLKKLSRAMKEFRTWANHSKLKASITVYKHKSCRLRFSKSGNSNIETAYNTHYVLLKANGKEIPKNDLMSSDISSENKTRESI